MHVAHCPVVTDTQKMHPQLSILLPCEVVGHLSSAPLRHAGGQCRDSPDSSAFCRSMSRVRLSSAPEESDSSWTRFRARRFHLSKITVYIPGLWRRSIYLIVLLTPRSLPSDLTRPVEGVVICSSGLESNSNPSPSVQFVRSLGLYSDSSLTRVRIQTRPPPEAGKNYCDGTLKQYLS